MDSRKYKQSYFQHNLLQVSEVYIKHFSATSYKSFSFKKKKKKTSEKNQQLSTPCTGSFLIPPLFFFFSSTINAEKPPFDKNMKTCYRNTLVREGASYPYWDGLSPL